MRLSSQGAPGAPAATPAVKSESTSEEREHQGMAMHQAMVKRMRGLLRGLMCLFWGDTRGDQQEGL